MQCDFDGRIYVKYVSIHKQNLKKVHIFVNEWKDLLIITNKQKLFRYSPQCAKSIIGI